MKTNLIVFFTFVCVLLVKSQNSQIRFEHLNQQNGLSYNRTTCMIQDKRGFIWIGTEDGLNRYDGNQFKVYLSETHDSTTLSSPFIISICEDSLQNGLWINTQSGINYLDIETDKIHRIDFKGKIKPVNNQFPKVLLVDSKSNVWISANELFIYNIETKKIQQIKDEQNPERILEINSVYEDKNIFWLVKNNGILIKYDSSKNKFEYFDFKIIGKTQGIKVLKIWKTSIENFWVLTQNCLVKFNPDKQVTFFYYPNSKEFKDVSFKSAAEDVLHSVWIGSNNHGIFQFNPINGTFVNYHNNTANNLSLSNNVINNLNTSNNGKILWICSTLGINKVDILYHKFKFYDLYFLTKDKTTDNYARSMFKDKNSNILFCDQKNLYIFNPELQVCKTLLLNSGKANVKTLINSWQNLPDGEIIVSTKNGIFNYSTVNQSFKQILKEINVNSFAFDSNRNIWFGTSQKPGMLLKMNISSAQMSNYAIPAHIQLNFQNLEVTAVDKLKNIWFYSKNGICSFNEKTGKFIPYINNPKDSGSCAKDVLHINCTSEGEIWIATYGKGIGKLDQKTGKFKYYTTRQGLVNNFVYTIIEDNQKNLWMSTNKGISKFDRKTGTFMNYNMDDGLLIEEYNSGSFFKSFDGELFFGGNSGFVSFYPNEILQNDEIPPVYINNFYLFNRVVDIGKNRVLNRQISYLHEITLEHNQNIIGFDFAVLNYIKSNKNKILFKLDGFDKKWNETKPSTYISYTNLNPGNYTLLVKGSNNDGAWNKNTIRLKITILSPLWQRWWAYTIYFIILSLILIYIAKVTIGRIKLKEAIKYEQLEKEFKLNLFTNISHELRTPLTLILSPLEEFYNSSSETALNKEHISLMHRNAKRLMQLINQLLDVRKIKTGKMELKVSQDDIVACAKEIFSTFDYVANQHNINYTFISNYQHFMLWFDFDKVEKIITNLLSNAFKFTPVNGEICLSISNPENKNIPVFHINKHFNDSPPFLLIGNDPGNDFIEIAVEDSGIGISQNHMKDVFELYYQEYKQLYKTSKGSGLGLSYSQELLLLHKGQMLVWSQENMGTRFAIRLSLNKNIYEKDEIVQSRTGIPNFLHKDKISFHPNDNFEYIDNQGNDKNKSIILIIEDNTDLRLYINDLLKSKYIVHQAVDGKDGLEKALSVLPDLIISDIMMPQMDGKELCKILKTDFRTNHIPVILLTAHSSVKHKIEGFETGADDYISKPFNSTILQLQIRNQLQTRKKLREQLHSYFQTENESKSPLNPMQDPFQEKIIQIIDLNYSSDEFDVAALADKIGLSRSSLYRKFSTINDISIHDFIQNYRLNNAAQLLQEGKYNVSEIAYRVGFKEHTNFTKLFTKKYGVYPSQYKEKTKS